jgi:hypothetical protein
MAFSIIVNANLQKPLGIINARNNLQGNLFYINHLTFVNILPLKLQICNITIV